MSVFRVQDFPGFSEPSIRKLIGKIEQQTSTQAAAATLAATPLFVAGFDGAVGDLSIITQNLMASGESIVVDVLKNGVTALSGALTVNAALGAAQGKVLPIFQLLTDAGKSFVKGDVYTVARTYVAGGGPAGGANQVVLEASIGQYRDTAYLPVRFTPSAIRPKERKHPWHTTISFGQRSRTRRRVAAKAQRDSPSSRRWGRSPWTRTSASVRTTAP